MMLRSLDDRRCVWTAAPCQLNDYLRLTQGPYRLMLLAFVGVPGLRTLQRRGRESVSMWERIGVIAAVAAVPVSIWLAVWTIRVQRDTAGHLGYEFISGIRLLAGEAARLSSGLRVMSESQLVADPYLLLVRLINTGRRAISEEDFQGEPCGIALDRVVLSAEIAGRSNPQMEAVPERKGNEAQLQPTLFKPGEWIALAILTDGKPGDQSVDLRSPHIAKPREYKPREYGEVAEMLSIIAGISLWFGLIALLSPINRYVVHRGS
jgi:hypothetical protein